jgi:hypothetical protein
MVTLAELGGDGGEVRYRKGIVVKYAFTVGEWLTRQFGEVVNRAARILTWIGVPAPEVGTAGTLLRKWLGCGP